MTLFWTVMRHDFQTHWRSTYGHPNRRRGFLMLVLVLVLAHALAALLGRAAPVTKPTLLGLALCSNALGRGGVDVLDTLFMNEHFAHEWRLPPVDWAKALLARFLSHVVIRSTPILILMSPAIFMGSLQHLFTALGYVCLPLMGIPWAAVGWTLLVPIFYRLGPQAAQFAAQSWRYLVLAVGAYIAIDQPAWSSLLFGWWATSGRILPGVAAYVSLAIVTSWGFVAVAKRRLESQVSIVSSGSFGGEAREAGRQTGFSAVVAKEWRILMRTPKYWAGLIVFPILEILVALAAFGHNRPALMANLSVFSPALLAMVVAEYLIQHDRDHIPLLFLAPLPAVRQMVAKAWVPLVLSLPMMLVGTPMLYQTRLAGSVVIGAATGTATAAFIAYVTIKQGFARGLSPSHSIEIWINTLTFLCMTTASLGVYFSISLPGAAVLTMYAVALLLAILPLIGVPHLPIRMKP